MSTTKIRSHRVQKKKKVDAFETQKYTQHKSIENEKCFLRAYTLNNSCPSRAHWSLKVRGSIKRGPINLHT